MTRKKKSASTKAKEQKLRMKQRRSLAKERSNCLVSNTSLNCPVSNTSLNCPVSSTSLNCPVEVWSSEKTINTEGWASEKTINTEVWASEKNHQFEMFNMSDENRKVKMSQPEIPYCMLDQTSKTVVNVMNTTDMKVSDIKNEDQVKTDNQNKGLDKMTETFQYMNRGRNTSFKGMQEILNNVKECRNKTKLNVKESTRTSFVDSGTQQYTEKSSFVSEDQTDSQLENRNRGESGLMNEFIVRGSFHQGDFRFGSNMGKQCVANCLAAMAYNKLKNVTQWDQKCLDNILTKGNEIYSCIHGTNDYLLISDLPESLEISEVSIHFTMKETIDAVIDHHDTIDFSQFANSLSLDLAIQESLIGTDGCFICVRDTTFLVIKSNDNLYLFDSHARNELGMPDSRGRSIVMALTNIDHLFQHCCNLARYFQETPPFNVTGITVSIESAPNEHIDIQSSINEDLEESEYMQDKMSSSFDSLQYISNSENINDHVDHNVSWYLHENSNMSDPEVVLEDHSGIVYDFKPLSKKTKQSLCSVLSIPSKHCSSTVTKSVLKMGSPTTTKSIKGDGNCFFRSISYAVSNRQEYHNKVRRAIVNHLLTNGKKFASFLRPQFKTVQEHVNSLKMTQENVWGTELEILASADLLGTDIYTFYNDTWIKYSPLQITSQEDPNDQSIYLKNTGNHFEVVVSVKESSSSVESLSSRERKRKAYTHQSLDSITSKESNDFLINLSKSEKEKLWYQIDGSFRDRKKLKSKEKYHSDQMYKNNLIQIAKRRYQTNYAYRESAKAQKVKSYNDNPELKLNKKFKYDIDDTYREGLKLLSFNKYKSDEGHRLKKKASSIHKYKENDDHRKKVKIASIQKYQDDEEHRKKVKVASVKKYTEDEDHRNKVKAASIEKYENDEEFKNKIKQQTRMRRTILKEKSTDIDFVVNKFKEEIKKGPEYVCACCFRLFFEKQVLACNREIYEKASENAKSTYNICISEKYVHKCQTSCQDGCNYRQTNRTSLWVCYTCHRKILKGQIPADSFYNSLELENVPKELSCLNTLEQHLVALNIPFMKLLCLPKGGQKGVHGPVVCVPSDINKVTSTLPRSEDDNQMVKVKLKRKLSYKGYDEYQFVGTKHLEDALRYLKSNNKWYSSVNINESWLNPIPEENGENDNGSEVCNVHSTSESNMENLEMVSSFTPVVTSEKHKATNSDELKNEEESYISDGLQGMQLDTCLQPADIGQVALDLCFDQVFNLSPAEGNTPISILKEEGIEAKTFPVHYPSGKNSFDEERNENLTIGRYFNLRLMNADNRFARDTSYIFSVNI